MPAVYIEYSYTQPHRNYFSFVAVFYGFTALLLRKETKDLDSLINDSYKLYSDFGIYNKSINDMTWNFNNGGWLKFSYYGGNYQSFKDRFQGRQYS